MHICFLSLDYPSPTGGGGVGNQVRTLGLALVRAGHRVTVLALAQPGLPESESDAGIAVHRFHQGNIHWYLFRIPVIGSLFGLAVREIEWAWNAYRLLDRVARAAPVDLVEITETGGLFATRCGVPVVMRLHGEQYTSCKYAPEPLTPGLRLARCVQRIPMRRAALLVSVSQAHAREIDAELRGKHPPIDVIPNVVSLPDGNSPMWGDSLMNGGIPNRDDRPIVFYAGRLERRKGVPLLLEAAALVVREVPDVRFMLAGAHHASLPVAELNALVERLSVKHCVTFLGHLTSQQLGRWYQRATVCVLPSYYETFGVAALEPMAFGIPVVATASSAFPEVVDDGVTGILFPAGDARMLADAILRLLRDPDLRAAMGANGRKAAREKFDAERLVSANLAAFGKARSLAEAPTRRTGASV